MKILGITHPGCEKISAQEIKELIGKECKVYDFKGCISFSCTKSQSNTIIKNSQSLIRIIELLDSGKIIQGIQDLKSIEKCKINIKEKQTFIVRSETVNSSLAAPKIEPKAGEYIINNIKNSAGFTPKVKFAQPDLLFLVYITKTLIPKQKSKNELNNDKFEDSEEFFFGLDITQKDLSKREYRVFASPSSVKGTLAYCLLRNAGIDNKSKIIDPNCKDGVIAIEAAKYLKTKVTASDPFKNNVLAARKNAQIAGVSDKIIFSKTDFDWLETEHNEKCFDAIVTILPSASPRNLKRIKQDYLEFIESCEFIIKDKGKISILMKNSKDFKTIISKKGIKIIKECVVFQGQDQLDMLLLTKAN